MEKVDAAEVAVRLARTGLPFSERALSSLVVYAHEHGLETVAGWVEDDPGLSFVPSWPFPMPWMSGFPAVRTTKGA
jgi:hypothetical protein